MGSPSAFHDVKENVFCHISIPISLLFLFRAVHDDGFNQTLLNTKCVAVGTEPIQGNLDSSPSILFEISESSGPLALDVLLSSHTQHTSI